VRERWWGRDGGDEDVMKKRGGAGEGGRRQKGGGVGKGREGERGGEGETTVQEIVRKKKWQSVR